MTAVSIIIVTFNSQKYIKDCLQSIQKFEGKIVEIIVVDNASSDSTLDEIRRSDVKVKLISLNENLGYSKANNIGAKKASGEYLFFLNPDTKLLMPTTKQLIKVYIENKNSGLIAPKLMEPSGKVQPSVRKLPTILGAIKEYFLNKQHEYEQFAPVTNFNIEAEVVYAGAILTTKKVFNKINGFEEKFFLYFEDIDLCRKLKENNLKIIYTPNVSLLHQVGGSSNPSKQKYLQKSSILYHGFLKSYMIYLIIKLSQIIKKYA